MKAMTLSSPHSAASTNANATSSKGFHFVGSVVSVGSLLIFEIPQSLIVSIDLLPQDVIFMDGPSLIVLKTADAVQSLQIDPAAKPNTDTVHDEWGLDVNLTMNRETLNQFVQTMKPKWTLTFPCSLSKSHSRSGPYGPMLWLNVSCKFVPEFVKASSVRPSVRHPLWKRICRSLIARSRNPVYRTCSKKWRSLVEWFSNDLTATH